MPKTLISKSEFFEAFRLQMWVASNRLVWGSLFILIFISVLDFILLPDYATELIILNLITVSLIIAVHSILTKIQQKPTILLHLVLLTLSFLSLYSIGITELPGTFLYLSFIAVLFVSFNSLAIWTSKDAIFQFLALCFIIVGMSFFQVIHFEELLKNGGYTTLSIVTISTIFPSIKMLNLNDKIQENYDKEKKLKEAELKLFDLEKEITNKNQTLKSIEKNSKIFRHDLKNKLASMETLIELIELEQQYVLKEGQHNYMKMIKNSLIDSRDEVEGFLSDFNSNTDDTKVELELSEIDIHNLIETNFYKFYNKISSRNIQINSLLKAKNSYAMLEKNYADIAIYNLLKYAVDFSKNNDQLDIATKNQDNYFILEIVNRNTGMSMLQLESYFKNINDYKLKEVQQNKGLGLSIAKNHIELLGGQLRFSASDSLGFEFIVEFPYTIPN